MPNSMDKLLASIDELDRLRHLSTPRLIHECIVAAITDIPLVNELMHRVDPNWTERYDDNGEPLPDTGLPPFPLNSSSPFDCLRADNGRLVDQLNHCADDCCQLRGVIYQMREWLVKERDRYWYYGQVYHAMSTAVAQLDFLADGKDEPK